VAADFSSLTPTLKGSAGISGTSITDITGT
jgi:hypothetical protein